MTDRKFVGLCIAATLGAVIGVLLVILWVILAKS